MIQVKKFILPCMLLALSSPSVASTRSVDQEDMQNFINEMTRQHKFEREELEKLLGKAKIHQSILDAISRPAEAKPWYKYKTIFLNPARIKGGVKFWNNNALTLKKASQKFGVPPEIMVAIIGVETRYGRHKGSFPVIDSLATLAFAYPPRSEFFRGELKQFLLMTREEKLDPTKQMGSYAGAMGMPQFISSSFRNYAVDFDDDGFRDLWNNPADAIGSVGNYFKRHGWKKGKPVVAQVKTHGRRFKSLLGRDLKPQHSYKSLKKYGVQFQKAYPSKLQGTLLEFDSGTKQPEYWVGWQNFYVISRYNHSAHYSMAVYQLAQEIRKRR
ncbi:MAG: lytic murein transglycosylase B [Gammaproteobacteria bacterium]|nr:lytic murein transglycosylase B [Gammaproteobacteria bacterium]